MRRMGLMILLGGALLAQHPAAAQAAPRDMILRGPGAAMTCSAWLELRDSADGLFASSARETYRGTLGWALGYLSGAARFGQGLDPLRNADEDATIGWVLDYCSAHRAQTFRSALEAFIEAHPAR